MLIVDIIRALSRAIETIKAGNHNPAKAHERVKGMYAWSDVAARTEVVYKNAMDSSRKDTYERLSRYVHGPLVAGANERLFTLGPVFGPILCIIMAVQHYFFWFLEWYDPREAIDLVEDHWTKEQFEQVS